MASNFLETYILFRQDRAQISMAWTSVFHLLPAADKSVARGLLERFIRVAQDSKLPDGLANAHLDHMLRDTANSQILSPTAAAADKSEVTLLSALLHQQCKFLA